MEETAIGDLLFMDWFTGLVDGDLQVERLEVAQRQFGEEDPQSIPYYNVYADYLERSRLRRSRLGNRCRLQAGWASVCRRRIDHAE